MTRGELWRRAGLACGLACAAVWVSLFGIDAARAQQPCAAGGACTTVSAPYHAPPPYAYPAAAVVPVYTAVYTPRDERPPADAHAENDTAAAIRELAAEVRALRAELAALRESSAAPQGPEAAPKAPAKLAAVDVARQACAGCHAPKAAEAKGGGFVLFADDSAAAFVNLSARDRVRIANRVKNGSMPPPPAKMNEPYRSELAAWAAGTPPANPPKK